MSCVVTNIPEMQSGGCSYHASGGSFSYLHAAGVNKARTYISLSHLRKPPLVKFSDHYNSVIVLAE